ncbi:MAG: peptide-methionine (R)-S-oxide reductase [Bacteroidetes bacterium 43-16]|nr:MAG: peptide-methionine (R)-S-oxide reductase [Bacteroidetes bacterium 43-16]
MKRSVLWLITVAALLSLVNCTSNAQKNETKMKADNPYYSRTDTTKLNVPNEEWKKILKPELYYVAREAGTERSFTGNMWEDETKGSYFCAVCGNPLFKSTAKFTSMCGWPSFFEPLSKDNMIYKEDYSHGMNRIEVECARCNSHLGHIFDDGPEPTGKRYCINAISVDFEPEP